MVGSPLGRDFPLLTELCVEVRPEGRLVIIELEVVELFTGFRRVKRALSLVLPLLLDEVRQLPRSLDSLTKTKKASHNGEAPSGTFFWGAMGWEAGLIASPALS